MVCLWRATPQRQGASSQLRHINVKDGETNRSGLSSEHEAGWGGL
jgi:hypothetical protein